VTAGGFTVWSLWQGKVEVPPVVRHQGWHDVSRDLARDFAKYLNRHYGREAGGTGRYLAGPVDRPPPVDAFE